MEISVVLRGADIGLTTGQVGVEKIDNLEGWRTFAG